MSIAGVEFQVLFEGEDGIIMAFELLVDIPQPAPADGIGRVLVRSPSGRGLEQLHAAQLSVQPAQVVPGQDLLRCQLDGAQGYEPPTASE